jgi:hypothetical protein
MERTATRTYRREFTLAFVAYALVLVVSVELLKANPTAGWWRIPLALAPMLPATGCLLAFVRYFHRLDELQRRIQLEAFAFAFGGTALLTFSYGFLEGVGSPHLDWRWVWTLMGALWLLGHVRATRRYR